MREQGRGGRGKRVEMEQENFRLEERVGLWGEKQEICRRFVRGNEVGGTKEGLGALEPAQGIALGLSTYSW